MSSDTASVTAIVEIAKSIDTSIKMAFLILGTLSMFMFIAWGLAYQYGSYWRYVPIGMGVILFATSVIFYRKKFKAPDRLK